MIKLSGMIDRQGKLHYCQDGYHDELCQILTGDKRADVFTLIKRGWVHVGITSGVYMWRGWLPSEKQQETLEAIRKVALELGVLPRFVLELGYFEEWVQLHS